MMVFLVPLESGGLSRQSDRFFVRLYCSQRPLVDDDLCYSLFSCVRKLNLIIHISV